MHVQSAYNVVVPLPTSNSSGLYALFNTFAGSIDLIDQSIVDGLKSLERSGSRLIQIRNAASYENRTKLSTEVLDYLDARGYLFGSLDEERIHARFVYEEMLRLHREIAAQPLAIVPTYNCDLKCPYCWQRLYNMDSPIISEEMVDSAFAAISELVEPQPNQSVDLGIFGGEPLQDIPELRDRILQICDLGKRAGFSVMAMSNGVGLAKAAPYLAGKMDQIQVTIDGPAEIHRRRRPLPKGDSFTSMVEGVDKALELGIPIKVRVNVDTTNLPSLPELANLARERGWLESGKLSFFAAPVKNHNPTKTINPESELLEDVLKLVDRDERMSVFDLSGFSGLKVLSGFQGIGDVLAAPVLQLRSADQLLALRRARRRLRLLGGRRHAGPRCGPIPSGGGDSRQQAAGVARAHDTGYRKLRRLHVTAALRRRLSVPRARARRLGAQLELRFADGRLHTVDPAPCGLAAGTRAERRPRGRSGHLRGRRVPRHA